MAGHSHSANIKYRKERVSAAKAKAFAKAARMITVAVRSGGVDPGANAKLRLAIEKARVISVPKDTIDRAIKKGSGDSELGDYEEVLYEGYGPGGVAVILEILTDNRHRTAADIRLVFERHGGNLGNSGVGLMDVRTKGVVRVSKSGGPAEEQLLELALAAGAEDLDGAGDAWEIRCDTTELETVRRALGGGGVTMLSAGLDWLAKTTVRIDSPELARRVLMCLDSLDDNDDVQSVVNNAEFPDPVIAALAAED